MVQNNNEVYCLSACCGLGQNQCDEEVKSAATANIGFLQSHAVDFGKIQEKIHSLVRLFNPRGVITFIEAISFRYILYSRN